MFALPVVRNFARCSAEVVSWEQEEKAAANPWPVGFAPHQPSKALPQKSPQKRAGRGPVEGLHTTKRFIVVFVACLHPGTARQVPGVPYFWMYFLLK